MPTGPMHVYDSALEALLASRSPSLATSPLTAVLLNPRHTVDLTSHRVFADIAGDEISDTDYKRRTLTGTRVQLETGGPVFLSDSVSFGNPVTLGPVGYMALVFGRAAGLKSDSALLGISELSIGGAVEAQRNVFRVSPPLDGWFQLSRS